MKKILYLIMCCVFINTYSQQEKFNEKIVVFHPERSEKLVELKNEYASKRKIDSLRNKYPLVRLNIYYYDLKGNVWKCKYKF